MNRRDFLMDGSLAASGFAIYQYVPSYARDILASDAHIKEDTLYHIFKDPDVKYRPYVRWWWNGDKIERSELVRELQLLKAAGIGGVEINPVAFPDLTDDLGIPSVKWLSDEWIDLLQFTFKEAQSLDMTCDLITGTGFPFGGEFLKDGERSQIAVIVVKKLEGPLNTEFSLFDLYVEADPKIGNDVYSGRTLEMLSVQLVPDPLNNMDEVVDLSAQIKEGTIKVSIPKGKFAVYGLVRAEGFEKVIVGAPGGRGPVLDHFNKEAVNKYLNNISEKITSRMGPMPSNFRSFFVDSMELQGANWTGDMLEEFKTRRGYDIFPYLPFILFKIGHQGNTFDPDYTVKTSPDLKKRLMRMRYDWALTNAEVFRENFVEQFAKWCKDNRVKSRAQAYGRGYFLLEGSFPVDIPECETWMAHGLGKDIAEADFTSYPWNLGQGITMINKYVSSAAHLKDKRLISSEELTNTERVFDGSFELFKIAGDLSTISGVTQPILHGFNYSPPLAPFPGWIRWGDYFNEKNTTWPYLHLYTDYRARISALLQQGIMYADIALLAPIPDLWGEFGAQNEPFPSVVLPYYQMLIWESIHQNGNGCDYVSEQVITAAKVEGGFMVYGSRKYHTIFLIEVRGIDPTVAGKLYEFISQGGTVFCIEAYPDHYPGWDSHLQKDEEVKSWVAKMKLFPDRFIFIRKPDKDFCGWMAGVQKKYHLSPYVEMAEPREYITQIRYQMEGAEVFFFTNSSDAHDYTLKASFTQDIVHQRQAWLWKAETGERFKLPVKEGQLRVALGPAASAIIVFNRDKKGGYLQPVPLKGGTETIIPGKKWDVELQYYHGHVEKTTMDTLSDLKDIPEYAHFAGTVKYTNVFNVDDPRNIQFLNLGRVYGISRVVVNGKDAGVKWYGHRVYAVKDLIHKGVNTLEVDVVTVMVNYMKNLMSNQVAQYWTNEGTKDQPLQSLGLIGPVSIY